MMFYKILHSHVDVVLPDYILVAKHMQDLLEVMI